MLASLLRKASYGFVGAYSKFRVSRQHDQQVVLFMGMQSTVGDLIKQLTLNFPVGENKLIAGSSFQPALLGYPLTQQAEEATKQISDQPMIEMLLGGQLFIYEAQGQRVLRCYGIECEEFNPTNNRNIPERIANCIVDLAEEWEDAKTVGDALALKKKEEDKQERQGLRVAADQAHATLVQLKDFVVQPQLGNPTNVFAIRMMALMSINWSFLFAVTYAKYGWDVGEPLSYLTSISVDLAALLGLFDLQQRLNMWMNIEQAQSRSLLNIDQQKKLLGWQLSYYRRQLL